MDERRECVDEIMVVVGKRTTEEEADERATYSRLLGSKVAF